MSLSMIRVGNRWLNPAHIGLIEMQPAKGETPLSVKVHMAQTSGPVVWTLAGDDAEAVLKEVGYGKEAREKEAADAIKAQEAESKAAAKKVEHDAKEKAEAEGPEHKHHAGHKHK